MRDKRALIINYVTCCGWRKLTVLMTCRDVMLTHPGVQLQGGLLWSHQKARWTWLQSRTGVVQKPAPSRFRSSSLLLHLDMGPPQAHQQSDKRSEKSTIYNVVTTVTSHVDRLPLLRPLLVVAAASSSLITLYPTPVALILKFPLLSPCITLLHMYECISFSAFLIVIFRMFFIYIWVEIFIEPISFTFSFFF